MIENMMFASRLMLATAFTIMAMSWAYGVYPKWAVLLSLIPFYAVAAFIILEF
jgi:hypothetical protein